MRLTTTGFAMLSAAGLIAAGPADPNLKTRNAGAGRMTWFDVGLGACGKTNVATDLVVALNPADYGGGERCGKTIAINYAGKTANAEVVDKCPGCPIGGLDASKGLFETFATVDKGVLYVDWSFN